MTKDNSQEYESSTIYDSIEQTDTPFISDSRPSPRIDLDPTATYYPKPENQVNKLAMAFYVGCLVTGISVIFWLISLIISRDFQPFIFLVMLGFFGLTFVATYIYLLCTNTIAKDYHYIILKKEGFEFQPINHFGQKRLTIPWEDIKLMGFYTIKNSDGYDGSNTRLLVQIKVPDINDRGHGIYKAETTALGSKEGFIDDVHRYSPDLKFFPTIPDHDIPKYLYTQHPDTVKHLYD